MKGKIAIEEAITMPELVYQAANYVLPDDQDYPEEWRLASRLLDVHGPTRLGEMDKHGVGMMVLSITSPGCQGEADQKKSEALAKRANDYMADIVSKNPARFQGFASVSMHDPAEAAEELTRAVKKLGLVGCMLNDWQSSGPNGDTMLHYDQDNYDIFWKTVQDLDVPVYMHPRLASPTVFKQLWEGRPGWGPQVFSTGVSIHTLGLCGNGVFDRFPKVQFVIGHLGEGIPADIWRLDHCNILCTVFPDFEGLGKGMHKRVKAKKSLIYYFQNNVHVTTSGHYCDETLKLCMNVMGADRVIYSIDTAYEWCEEGAKWWDNIDWLSDADKVKMGRDNAIKLFKLKNVPETPVNR